MDAFLIYIYKLCRYEERKSNIQDPSNYVKIESLCLSNGGNIQLAVDNDINQVRQ